MKHNNDKKKFEEIRKNILELKQKNHQKEKTSQKNPKRPKTRDQKKEKNSQKPKIKRKNRLTSFLYSFYSLIPKAYRERINQEVIYAGFLDSQITFISSLILTFIIIGIIYLSFIIYLFGFNYLYMIPFLIIISIGFIAPYLIFSILADSRKKHMEMLLPDMLMLTASNIKSGLTIDRALLFSARPEFGELGREIKRVAFEIFGGKEVSLALKGLAGRIKSDILSKTIDLLIEGLKSGGAVAKLLEETATDIKNTELLQKEIKGNVMMYTMFIFIAAVMGAPSLFAISHFLITSTTTMWAGNDISIDTPQEQQPFSFFKMSSPQVDLEAFNLFALISILITTTFAAILISLIQTGKIRSSVKYAPFFILTSLLLYYSIKLMLKKIFGSMINI